MTGTQASPTTTTAATATAAATTLSALRCPESQNSSDFWYIARGRWSTLLNEAQDASKKKQALATLRKHDFAGRVMETDAGVAPAQPCVTCTQASVECKVDMEAMGSACAYCRRMNKSGCRYEMTVAAPPAGLGASQVSTVEERLASLERRQQQYQEIIDRQAQQIDLLNGHCAQLGVDYQALRVRHDALAALVTTTDLEARVATLELSSPKMNPLAPSVANSDVSSVEE